MRRLCLAAALVLGTLPVSGAAPGQPQIQGSAAHAQLVSLFQEWRTFVRPAIVNGRPDYSPAAMAANARAIPQWRSRLARIDRRGMSAADANDVRIVEAEINAFDFFHRVLRPWARDPGFYQTIFAEMSDVPAHEGPSAEPNIDLWQYSYPLSAADDARRRPASKLFPRCWPTPAGILPPATLMNCGLMATAPSASRRRPLLTGKPESSR